jgi:putative membrane protein
MQFLKTLFWVVVAVIAVVFSIRNWHPAVTINLWGGMQADVKLPLLLLGAWLLGFLPPFIVFRATRWRLRRRLESAERALADARPPETVVPAAEEEPVLPVPPVLS